MYCKHCGAQIVDDSTFCSSCGTKLTADPAPVAADPAPSPSKKTPLPASMTSFTQTTLPTGQPTDKYLWLFAIIPLFVSALFPYFLNRNTAQMVSSLVMIILQIIFLVYDKHECDDLGYNTNGWVPLGILLPPVYLIVRPSHTTKNFLPFVCWLLLFLFFNPYMTLIRLF